MGHWNFYDHLAGWNNHFYNQISKEIQSNKEVLKLRMERMKSYRQQRRLRRGISVSVLFGMIILSAATVFASGIGFVKAYDKIADETREEINVGTEGDIKEKKAKYRMYDKTRIKKCMIKNERLKENDGKPFTWKIKPKERIETKEGYYFVVTEEYKKGAKQ